MNNSITTKHYSIYFVVVVSMFITCLIISNIIAVKLINIIGIILPAAVIIFPVSYIIGDILTEVYGYNETRKVIWLGFLCNLITVIFIQIAGYIPPASLWNGQAAYDHIFKYSFRILSASFVAYALGEFTNSFVLAKLKIATHGRWLWTRTIGSTLVGQGLDSSVFLSIAFIGTIPMGVLFSMIITQWLFKCIFEIIATPFTYITVYFLKKREATDIYDHNTNFNPFALKDVFFEHRS